MAKVANVPQATMQVTIDDPDSMETKTVGNDGRIYLGTALAGKNVKVVLEIQDDVAETSENSDNTPEEEISA